MADGGWIGLRSVGHSRSPFQCHAGRRPEIFSLFWLGISAASEVLVLAGYYNTVMEGCLWHPGQDGG